MAYDFLIELRGAHTEPVVCAVSLRTASFNIQKILHSACFALSVLYGSQNRQQLLCYTSFTDWFL